MKIESYKRILLGSDVQLLDAFFQVILHEFNAYEFSEKDWKEFALAYGKLWYSSDLLWVDLLKPFEGKTKAELTHILQCPKNQGVNESFSTVCESVLSFLSEVPYNINEAYIDLVDFNSFAPYNDINEHIPSIFSAIKGSFDPIEHVRGIWAFNAIDLRTHLVQLKQHFDKLFTLYLALDKVSFLNSFVNAGETETLYLKKKVNGVKEALIQEMSLYPDILTRPVDRIIFLIDLKYQKMDESPLNPESLRRAVNRLKKTRPL